MNQFRQWLAEVVGDSKVLHVAQNRATNIKPSADDLVQRACVRAMRYENDFDPEGKGYKAFAAWFKVIINSIASNAYRHEKIVDRTHNALRYKYEHACCAPAEPQEPEAPARVDGRRAERAMFNALDDVSDEYRSVLVLRARGYSYHEIADELDVAEGTVMSRLHRGRRQLAGVLEASPDWDFATPSKFCSPR